MQYPTIAQPQYAFAPTMMAEGGLVPAARAVQSKGRNGDSMLVHMTPGEVGGLQALAMQHGGSLSINPQTGLPEAGFLKNILPTVLGFALTPFMGPLAAGLTVGGIETVRTGDIGKGFMAGLGAYGGANLAGSLTAAGAQQGVQAATAAGADLTAQTGSLAAENARDALLARSAETLPASVASLPTPTGLAPTIGSQYGQMAQGAQNLFASGATGEGARAAAMGNLGGYTGLAKTAGMAGAPLIADALTPKPYEAPPVTKEESNYAGPYKPSERQVSYPGDDLRRRTSEYTYFTPSNPIPFAEGGETAGASEATPDVFVSPNEARVYQDIMNVQRLAGLPALDPSRFAVLPGRSYEQFVYNPIEAGPSAGGVGPEKNYGFAPLMSKEEAEAALAPKEEGSRRKGVFGGLFGTANTVVGYTRSGEPIYQNDPMRHSIIGGFGEAVGMFAKGGVPMLEDGGFVLTKKAVDGLGKGSNKKGQRVASAGLGAIPIKGAGAKRGPKAGVDDKIKTSIEGKRPALVSNGEAYVPKKQVAKRGGAKAFYALMKKAERRA